MMNAEVIFLLGAFAALSIAFWCASRMTYQDPLNRIAASYPVETDWEGELRSSSCSFGHASVSKEWYNVGFNEQGIYLEHVKNPLELMKINSTPALVPWNSIVRCSKHEPSFLANAIVFWLDNDLSICLPYKSLNGAETFLPQLKNLESH